LKYCAYDLEINGVVVRFEDKCKKIEFNDRKEMIRTLSMEMKTWLKLMNMNVEACQHMRNQSHHGKAH